MVRKHWLIKYSDSRCYGTTDIDLKGHYEVSSVVVVVLPTPPSSCLLMPHSSAEVGENISDL